MNRAVAELRKALRRVGGRVGVETIPKAGYRLSFEEFVPDGAARAQAAPAHDDAAPRPSVESRNPAPQASPPARSRRAYLVSCTAGVAALGLGALALGGIPLDERRSRSAALTIQAAAIMRDDRWGAIDPMVLLREATRLRPDNARAWGLLSLAMRDYAQNVATPPAFEAVSECRLAASRALDIDAEQSDALTALATLTPFYTDWFQAEQRLKVLVQRFGDHEAPLVAIAELYACTGRAVDCLHVRARLAQIEPTSVQYAVCAAAASWMAGDQPQLDKRLAGVLRTWPTGNAAVDELHFQLLGFTGHPAQALDLLKVVGDLQSNAPLVFEAQVAAFKAQAGLCGVDAAIEAALAAARRSQSSAAQMIPLLAFLGAVDHAFAVSDGYYLNQGQVQVPHKFGATQTSIVEMRDRRTGWLFSPAARSLWPDPRFRALCRKIGLSDYWRSAVVRPDLLGTHAFEI